MKAEGVSPTLCGRLVARPMETSLLGRQCGKELKMIPAASQVSLVKGICMKKIAACLRASEAGDSAVDLQATYRRLMQPGSSRSECSRSDYRDSKVASVLRQHD